MIKFKLYTLIIFPQDTILRMHADYIPAECNTNYTRWLQSTIYNMKSGPPRSGWGPSGTLQQGRNGTGKSNETNQRASWARCSHSWTLEFVTLNTTILFTPSRSYWIYIYIHGSFQIRVC